MASPRAGDLGLENAAEVEADLIESRRFAAEIDPAVVVAHLQEEGAAGIPAQAGADAITDAVVAVGHGIGAADVTVPRVPVTALAVTRGDVRVDPHPADGAVGIRGEPAWQDVDGESHHRATDVRLVAVVEVETAGRTRVGLHVRRVVERAPAEIGADIDSLVDVVAEAHPPTEVVVECEAAPTAVPNCLTEGVRHEHVS